MKSLRLEPRPLDGPALDEVDADRRRAGVLDGHAADFAVALAGMGVADEQAGARHANRQIGDRARPHIRQVHGAAVIVGRKRADRIDLRRAAQGADMRLVGQLDLVAPMDRLLVDQDLAHDLGQRLVQRRRVIGAGERAELGNERAGPARLLAARQHLLDMDGQRIARRGALDDDRPVLRVGERQADLLAGLVGLGLDAAAEGVARVDDDTVAGIDGQHGLRIGPDREMELGLLFLGERMRLARLAGGDPAPVHDRLRDPAVVAHGAVLILWFGVPRFRLAAGACASPSRAGRRVPRAAEGPPPGGATRAGRRPAIPWR
jgi:hypothetical protein